MMMIISNQFNPTFDELMANSVQFGTRCCLPYRWLILLAVCLNAFALTATVQASPQQFGNFGFGASSEPITLESSIRQLNDSQQAILEVVGTIAPGSHTYSTTQKDGRPSKLVVAKNDQYRLLGSFHAIEKPIVHDPHKELGFRTEEFEGTVTWQVAIEFSAGVDVAKQKIKITYNGLVCEESGSCIPVNDLATTAKLGKKIDLIDEKLLAQKETTAPVKQTAKLPQGPQTFEAGHAILTGTLSPQVLKPGDKGTITLTAEMLDGYHTYAYLGPNDPAGFFSPTYLDVLAVSETATNLDAFEFSKPVPSEIPHDHVLEGLDEIVPIHEGVVDWKINFTVPQDQPTGNFVITGVMQSQTCRDSCDPPFGLSWQIPLTIGDTQAAGSVAAHWQTTNNPTKDIITKTEVAQQLLASLGVAVVGRNGDGVPVVETNIANYKETPAFDISAITPELYKQSETYSLPAILGIALLGGFILNFMPCVLPVIGLKILSLVEQAGESRFRALTFNSVYVLGMLSVFWVLAILISSKDFGWGSQFSSTLFNITFSAIVFSMALSYLEVWEIVLPSFVGTQSTKLDQKDGLVGTFFKGIVTTILATPCSGPGLATALAWCADKPAWLVLVVFTFLGLGMGLPYLLVAIYPPIISFLPKPGPWMNTFKQVMGFVLLGTVAFFLSYIDMEYLFPTLCFLMVVWFGCWLVGRLSFLSKPTTWLGTWASAVAVVLISSHFIFGWQLTDGLNKIVGGNFNNTFANDWNLRSSQSYRLNTFVDRQLSERSSRPVAERNENQAEINWETFSLQALEHHTKGEQPKTVFIDFTAEWCANCKVFERVVLHNEEMTKRLNNKNVIAMVADKTYHNQEIDDLLKSLGGGVQIPIYAVFTAADPTKPIVLNASTISFENVTAALDKAGVPSASEIENQSIAATPDTKLDSKSTDVNRFTTSEASTVQLLDELPTPSNAEQNVAARTNDSM